MNSFLKYMGVFFLMVVAAALAMLAIGAYQTFDKMNTFFEGADTYTCGQFVTDVQMDGASKIFPIVLATLAYGGSLGDSAAFEKQMEAEGMMPGLKTLFAKCKTQPAAKVFDVLAADVASGGDAAVRGTVVGTGVSGTLPAGTQEKKK